MSHANVPVVYVVVVTIWAWQNEQLILTGLSRKIIGCTYCGDVTTTVCVAGWYMGGGAVYPAGGGTG